jgi:hypothetical protein
MTQRRPAGHSSTSALRPPSMEWQEQHSLMQWAKLHEHVEPRLALLFHIPNGEHRDKRTGVKLAKMGVKPGVPDMCLPVAVRLHYEQNGAERWESFHGCFIEMKRAVYPAKVALDQSIWHTLLFAQGYYVYVAQGWVDAAGQLCWYLHRPDLAQGLCPYEAPPRGDSHV